MCRRIYLCKCFCIFEVFKQEPSNVHIIIIRTVFCWIYLWRTLWTLNTHTFFLLKWLWLLWPIRQQFINWSLFVKSISFYFFSIAAYIWVKILVYYSDERCCNKKSSYLDLNTNIIMYVYSTWMNIYLFIYLFTIIHTSLYVHIKYDVAS